MFLFLAHSLLNTGLKYLQFTADVWDPEAPEDLKSRKISTNRSKFFPFPYLDMELYWQGEELKFQVYLKKTQQLK